MARGAGTAGTKLKVMSAVNPLAARLLTNPSFTPSRPQAQASPPVRPSALTISLRYTLSLRLASNSHLHGRKIVQIPKFDYLGVGGEDIFFKGRVCVLFYDLLAPNVELSGCLEFGMSFLGEFGVGR